MKPNIIIYDLEILRAIPNRNGECELGIEYCAGWHDHANMGIAVLGVYDYAENRYRVFCLDNKHEFANLVGERRPLCVGFNNIAFDNVVLGATHGWQAPAEGECYDVLRETWAAAGLGPEFAIPSHVGFGLDAICERNFGLRKSGNGALAPVQWQLGDFGTVIDYCLTDVWLTKQLMDTVLAGEPVISPKDGRTLMLRVPEAMGKK
jgi:hypothetical protein